MSLRITFASERDEGNYESMLADEVCCVLNLDDSVPFSQSLLDKAFFVLAKNLEKAYVQKKDAHAALEIYQEAAQEKLTMNAINTLVADREKADIWAEKSKEQFDRMSTYALASGYYTLHDWKLYRLLDPSTLKETGGEMI